MGAYVGDVYIPFVSGFSVDKVSKPTEVIKHLGNIPPHVAEFRSDVRTVEMTGTLIKVVGTVKTADQYAEDLQSLVDRPGSYNFLHNYQNRSGWITFEDADVPKEADKALIREYALHGLFLPMAKYQSRYHSTPQIRTNPWSHSLGVNDCDNYIALPIGATYSGGDGSTITRESEDGTITLVLATSDSDIKFDVSESDVDNGEVKIWDDMNEVLESNWIKVFHQDHSFMGKPVIQNGLYRVILDSTSNYISIYGWNGSAYTKIDDFTAASFSMAWLTYVTPDKVICNLSSGVEITISRGHPPLIDTGTIDLLYVSLAPSDQSTSTDNYLSLGTDLYICSDANFSIVAATKNLGSGKKWIFYETLAATAEDIAHQVLVDQRLKRELVAR